MYALLAICCFLLGAVVGYYLNNSKNEPDAPLEELPIPVIGSKKVDWDEYRDIPKINIDNPIPKFNRNNI